ncbi:uncharacterized protein [Rutidosis leptorrhynchoides]|uniref:uncharacterized protein n=1 Tax=Rutidosis leptorrhynchoides TaxID=125765 RepID=UPI003A99C2C4
MAMRGRGGRGNLNRPPRLGRVYEQFKPMSEWRQEDDHDILLVYLPGFQKEYIKVTTEDLNIVRVRGERLVGGNKWSRFQEDFRVPENCEMSGIRARFDGGILTITMPRKIINTPPPTVTTTTTQVAPKTEEQPFKRTKQEDALQKRKEELNEKKPSTTLEDKNNLPPQPIAKPNSSSSSTDSDETEEFKFGTLPTSVPKKADKHDVGEKPNISEKTDLNDGEKGLQTLLGDKARNIEGKMGKLNGDPSVHGDKTEKNKVAGRSVLGVLNEDRKVLVNVGVGVLVIVALGVHVSYTIGLIGNKGK